MFLDFEQHSDNIVFGITTYEGETFDILLPTNAKLLELAEYMSSVIDASDVTDDVMLQFDQVYIFEYATQMLMGVYLLDILIDNGVDIATPSGIAH